jgi:hypothetical protein
LFRTRRKRFYAWGKEALTVIAALNPKQASSSEAKGEGNTL